VASSDSEGDFEYDTDLDITTRIVGGYDASPGAYPFFGRYRGDGCLGVLVSMDVHLDLTAFCLSTMERMRSHSHLVSPRTREQYSRGFPSLPI